LRWRKRRREFRRIAAFFKQSFEFKIKGDLIPEAAAEEIIGELQALFARHRINFELQGNLKWPSGFSFQISSFSFFCPWCRSRRA
jgi:hypothetical protein